MFSMHQHACARAASATVCPIQALQTSRRARYLRVPGEQKRSWKIDLGKVPK